MYETVTIEEAQEHPAELIAGLTPGQEIIITSNDQPVVELRLLPVEGQPRFGSAKGSLVIPAEDDEHLKDFSKHMNEPDESFLDRGIIKADARE